MAVTGLDLNWVQIAGAMALAALVSPGVADGGTTLLLGSVLLALIAFAAVSGVLLARRQTREATRIAHSRAKTMHDLLRTVRMAETIASLDVWQYDPYTAEQQWSDGLRELFGMCPVEELASGDAETLLYANDIDLVSHVARRNKERAPFTVHYDIHGCDGVPRSITVQACNLLNESGGVARVVAVVRDVTDQLTRERQLEHSRQAAIDEARVARELADTDPLTVLANRRRIVSELDRMIIDSRRFSDPLVLIVLDIDRFKVVNDTHGHQIGDKVLRRVAEITYDQTREMDVVGRVGGEEFVWIVPLVNQLQVKGMAERLRQAVSQSSAAGPVASVTVSVGLVQLRSSDTSITLPARADNALYTAKTARRNFVDLAA